MNEREQFEAFAFKKWGTTGGGLKQAADGSYIRWAVDYAWDAWKARAALAARSVPGEASELVERLRRVSDQFTCHPASIGIAACEEAGELMRAAAAALAASPVPAPGEVGKMVEMLRSFARGMRLGNEAACWTAMCEAADRIEAMAAVGVRQEQIIDMERAASPVPADLLAFLRGAAPLEGVWFGERHPTRKGAFWWRALLPTAPNGLTESAASVSAPAQQADVVTVDAVAWEGFIADYERYAKGDPKMPFSELRASLSAVIHSAATAPAVEAQADKLETLSREIVKLHKERGCVLTVHVEQMADLLAEIDALKEPQR